MPGPACRQHQAAAVPRAAPAGHAADRAAGRTGKDRIVKLQCQFEQELVDAVSARRWPDRADSALREHVTGCRLCSDVAAVAMAFFEDRDGAHADEPVPSASAVWWRAQIRAREEAARMAMRPLVLVQAVATICAAIA